VALSEIDRNLLERCVQRKPRAWEDFVDRFMGLLIHVIQHTAQARGVRLSGEDRDDLCSEVFLAIIKNDFELLRKFRGDSSLATYLTVVARRLVVHSLLDRKSAARLDEATLHGTGNGGQRAAPPRSEAIPDAEQRIIDREEVDHLLDGLGDHEAQVVRMYHLEGKSYQEISSQAHIPMGTIGPILTRAREKMRRTGVDTTAG